MLGFLAGTVTAQLGDRLLIRSGDVGYWVRTGGWQPSQGSSVELYLHHHLREGAEELFGFQTLEALALFERLIGVNGVGPRAGLALLASSTPEALVAAIDTGDLGVLKRAPGIGPKVAQKILLELRGKLTFDTTPSSPLAAALQDLGYKSSEVSALVESAPKGSLETQLGWALKELGKKR